MERLDVEILEQLLRQHPSVEQCVVLARTSGSATRRVVAYVTGGGVDESSLRSYLENQISGIVLPEAYVVLDQLPLRPNGYVDRNALPDPFQVDPRDP